MENFQFDLHPVLFPLFFVIPPQEMGHSQVKAIISEGLASLEEQ